MLFHTEFNKDNVIWFDVETAGEKEHYRDLFGRKLLLWEKKCNKLKQLPQFCDHTYEQLWNEKCSLTLEYAKIICVTVGMIDKSGQPQVRSFSGDDEKNILTSVNDTFNRCKPGTFLGGFNIKRYDIPILCKRMVMHGILPSKLLFILGQKPWEAKVLDLSDVWQFGDRDYTSLDTLTCVLGIDSPKDALEGKDVHGAYYAGRLSEIVAYCEKDVLCLFKVIDKFIDLAI